ncbi:16S rRNA (guanine(527)-N(7))-methyltransferase RsmG [Endozoicomonas sp. G2_1]|uniref:16S rRNA (guanine(527)-N(7))-methyltransferase RsmG n=1 Tax=Endozoicomonas sp. G2_1 TaxID=2821091 RepID=UPI001AD98735|nr:16S rRNA (guanine(527)-N(7))-methyltransferase RsmG [Endozoicomonas sp. G2_1]MBO9491284.1 16S rRNA (guanine(527)-N(7))-methyltransferase RsmG [Endozoicomonas sp. G2_1]
MTLAHQLDSLLDQTPLQVSPAQRQQLVAYVELLNKWNKAYNLTSVRNPEDMLVKHILDSLVVGPKLAGQHFIDVGTGPGLPGIPLAILYPERNFVLLDSLGKRITFLRQVVFQLKLTNVTPMLSRVEEFQPEQPFDGVLSRAFASLQDMVNWCQHLIDTNGRFYALKGLLPEQEFSELPDNIQVSASHQLQVPQLDGERHLIELIKLN